MKICQNCGQPLILNGGKCVYCHQAPDYSIWDGEEQSGKSEKTDYYNKQLEQRTNQQNTQRPSPNRSCITCNKTIKKWFWGIIVLTSLFLLCILFHSIITKRPSLSDDIPIERKIYAESYPQDITGNYFVRMMKGREDVNATIKIYNEGGEYAMNVYSSNITKKYTFSYDSSTGEIISQDLGKGTIRIKELTNEIEITFEGWKLVK